MRTLAIVVLTCLAAHAPAAAQDASQSNQLIGTWQLTIADNVSPDGARVHLYGPDPQGVLMFDAGGHYSLQIMSADCPKFAAMIKVRAQQRSTVPPFKAAIAISADM